MARISEFFYKEFKWRHSNLFFLFFEGVGGWLG